MHTICRFEGQEVRSPMLQTTCKLELKRRSYVRLKTNAQTMNGNVAAAPPISQLLDTFRSTSWSPFHVYHILFRNLGSQESSALNGTRFGVETKKLWAFENNRANHERKCCSLTPILQLLDTFWCTSWSSNYTYYISFRSSGSQESNASNGVQIGVETKKLWPFEDERSKRMHQ